jgi:hypothetical protein
MNRLIRIFVLSKSEQRVVLIVLLALIAAALVGYERRAHQVPVQQTTATESKASATPLGTEEEQ